MPNQTVTIKLHDAKTIISAFQVTKTHDQPVTIQAQKGINYELIDDATQFAPENIKIQRVGDDLYISFEADGDSALDPDLIIQGYYGTDGNTSNLLIGLHENGNYYAYVPESGLQQNAVSMLADQMSAGQALGGEALTSAAYEFNPYWLLALIPIVGLAAAGGGGGGGGGGTPAPSADKAPVLIIDEAKDGYVNAEELSDGIQTNVSLPSGTEVDDIITLTITHPDDSTSEVIHIVTAIDLSEGSVDITIPKDEIPADGNYSVKAQISDAAGNSSDPSTPVDFEVDATVPGDTDGNGLTDTAPVLTIAEAQDDGYVNAEELSNGIQTNVSLPSGTEVDDIITLTITHPDDSTSEVIHIVTAIDLSEGSVDITIPKDEIPADGNYSVKAQISDAAGNSSDPSTPVDFEVDATVPGDTDGNGLTDTAPVLTIAEAQDDGYVNAEELSNGIQTNVSLPSGTEVDDIITLTITHPDDSTSEVIHIVTAIDLSEGSVDITIPKDEIPADGNYSVKAQISDAAGNSSDPSTPVDFEVDATVPGDTDGNGLTDTAPVLTIAEAQDDGYVNAEELSNGIQTNVSLPSGTEVDDIITLTITHPDDSTSEVTHIVTAIDLSEGSVDITIPKDEIPADGNYSVKAQISDAAGNSSDPSTPVDFEVDATVPGDTDGNGLTDTAPVLTIAEAQDDGYVNAEELSNGIQTNVSLPSGTEVDDIITLTITHPDDSTSEVTHIVTAIDLSEGSVDITIPKDEIPADGNYSVKAQISDAAGNSSDPSTPVDFEVDATVPGDTDGNGLTDTAPVLTIAEAQDDGYVNAEELSNGIQTNVSLPSGTEVDDIITLTITHPDDSTSEVTHIVTAIDLSEGSVDITIPKDEIPADGNYSVKAQISDAAGNSSDPSTPVDFEVDATVPGDTDGNGLTDTAPVLTIAEAQDDGYVNAEELSNGIQTNVSLPSGTEVDDIITLTITHPDDSTSEVTHIVTAIDLSEGSVDITIPKDEIPADGNYSVKAQISDAAGNSSDPSTPVDFEVDAIAPNTGDGQNSINFEDGGDELLNSSEVTNVTLTGQIEADANVDGISITDGITTLIVSAADIIVDSNGVVSVSGQDLSSLNDGELTVTMQITDAAGNSGSVTDTTTLDTTPPSTTLVIDSITSDNVITLSEAIGTINVSGSVSGEFQIGDEVTLTINNQIYTTQIQSGGVWSVAVSGSELVDDGDLTIEASALVHDAAGNEAEVDAEKSYALDTSTASADLDEAGLMTQSSVEVTSQLSGTYTDLALVVPNISLFSQGDPITWTLSTDGKILTGATTQNDVLMVTLTGSSNAWSYQVELLDSIDHAGDVESLIFTLEDDGSPVLEKISIDVIDDVPILAENVTYDFGDTPSIYFGNAVDSFGADGGHLTTATINGVTYTYDALADSITYTGSTTQFDPDNYSFEDGVLSLTTNFGDSIRINFQTGEYSVESTGEGIGTEPAQVAPTAMIADQGGLLGSVGLNALDLIDLTANQKFTVADANNDITSVSLSLTTNLGDALLNSLNINLGLITLPLGDVLASLGVGYVINLLGGTIGGLLSFLGLTSYGLTASQDLATELGITITIGDESFISDGSGGYVYGQTITFTLTNSDPVSTQAFNELLASITVDDAFLGDIADLSLAPTYTLNVVDSLAQSDTEVSTDVANVSLLGNLLGSDTSGFLTEGTAGGESIDKSAETTNQRIYGYAGDDTLTGGSGNDLIRGGSGDDTIVAGNGNDLIYGGTGNDELTGNDGTDVFVWEQGDGGSTADPAIDIITDFNTASAAIGGDVLDLSGLLQGEGKIGNLVGNLAAYIHFETVNNQTEIWISTTGEFTGGYDASESSKVDQKIILSGVDYAADTRTDAEIIQELLSKGKLIVDDLYGSVGSQESLEIDFTAIDNDLDVATKLSDGSSTTTVSLDSTTVEPETDLVDSLVNEDPVAMLADRTLLGLIGVGALGLIDLDRQVYGAYDVDNNIAKVEIQFGSLLTVAPTKIIIDASERLAQELGLKLSYASTEGTLTLLGYSYTLTVTALDGGAIDNVKLNELLATVQLSNENGTLLNSSTLSLEVLQAMQITVTDTNGAVDSDTVASLADANLINSLGDYNACITEGTNLSETLDESAASMGQRIYAYDGDDVITGSNFNDWIRAGSGDDTVNAGSGNDVIFGGLGNDIIDGDAGNDRILGEAGNDTITGGAGSDTLMFQVLDGEESDNAGGNGTDTWLDFHLGNTTTDDQADKIDISDLLVNYSGDGSAASLSDYLSVNSDGTDTTIRIDRDGAGGQYQSTDLVVLKGVDTTLTELITNQQIIL